MIKVKAGDIWRGTGDKPLTVEIKYASEQLPYVVVESAHGESILEKRLLLRNYTKVEPFFEVGKTYRSGGETFKVDYIGEIDGAPYAAGVYRVSASRAPYAVAFATLSDWQEV